MLNRAGITGRGSEKGIVFSIDSAIAIILMVAMLYIFSFALNSLEEKSISELKQFKFKRNALSLMDSLVKNRNEENPAFGSAVFDAGKKRVRENFLDEVLLEKADFSGIEVMHVGSVVLKFRDGGEKTIKSNSLQEEGCISLQRFVLAGNRKAKLVVGVCENE